MLPITLNYTRLQFIVLIDVVDDFIKNYVPNQDSNVDYIVDIAKIAGKLSTNMNSITIDSHSQLQALDDMLTQWEDRMDAVTLAVNVVQLNELRPLINTIRMLANS